MVIPFSLKFFRNQADGQSFFHFSNTLDAALEEIDKYTFTCNELQDLRIQFESSNKDASLWIEIMDMLPQHIFSSKETSIQKFLPSNTIRSLFLNFQSIFNIDKTHYSNLLPGVYRMVVTVGENERYFAFLKIQPLRVEDEQLYLMRAEIESILNGLAKEVATKRNSLDSEEQSDISDLLRKYNLLIQYADNIIANLRLILKEPRQLIAKEYITKPVGQPIRSDFRTIKMKLNKPNINSKVPSFNYLLNYDISFNRNLKNILLDIETDIIQVENYLTEILRVLEEDLSIQEKYKSPTAEIRRKIDIVCQHQSVLNQLRANLNYTLRQHWLEKIEANMHNQDKLARIPYYRSIYSVFRMLKDKHSSNLNPVQLYIYSWKETSKLYEIWGFLRLLLMLKNNPYLEVSHISGWIFDKRPSEVYPFLEPETKITLTNMRGLKLVVIYDSLISKPDKSADTIDNPLISIENSNRPDFRLDIYQNNYFRGSILADFKYRSLDKLGNPDIYMKNKEFDYGYKVYSQLMDYTYTKSFYMNRKEKRKRNADFAVKRVLGIFPKYSEQSVSFIRDGVTSIIRCSLSPGTEANQIESEIISIIDECLDEENDI